MVSKKDSNKARLQRHKRVRAKINGTAIWNMYSEEWKI